MFGVLAEDRSDAESLKGIIRSIARNQRLPVKAKGFGGCGELVTKGPRQLKLFAEQGCRYYIICRDADGPSQVAATLQLQAAFAGRLNERVCLVVPVQELEAWLIADEAAIRNVIPSLKIKPVGSPESIPSPKEWLTRESRKDRTRPLFVPQVHNELIAVKLDVGIVQKKCPSFLPLAEFVRRNAGSGR